MTAFSPAARALVSLMGDTPRGPRREGLFALWLTLRLVEDLLLEPPQPERTIRRRVTLVERRLSSLTLPPPLRRGLVTVLQELAQAGRKDAPALLTLLAAPTRDGLGAEAADTISRAARAARA